jgi:hypothetical protein
VASGRGTSQSSGSKGAMGEKEQHAVGREGKGEEDDDEEAFEDEGFNYHEFMRKM